MSLQHRQRPDSAATPPALVDRRWWLKPLVAGGILALALAWRLFGITGTEVWRDEAVTLIHARASWWDLVTKLPFVEDTPPLSFLLFKLWSLLFTSEVGMRMLPVLAGVATVAVLMKVADEIHPRAMWPVGLLAAFSHVPVHYSQELRVYSLLMLVTAICLWCSQRMAASANPKRWAVLLAVLCGLAAHCHAVGMFVYPMMLCYLLVARPIRDWRQVVTVRGIVLWLVLICPMIWFNLHWARFHVSQGNWWIPAFDADRAATLAERFFGLAAVDAWVRSANDSLHMWTGFLLERGLIVLPVCLVFVGLTDRQVRRPMLALAAAAACNLGLLIITSTLSLPNILVRTFLPTWLLVVLLMGVAAAAGTTRPIRRLQVSMAVALAALYAASGAWAAYHGPDHHFTSTKAFAWLSGQLQPDDVVVYEPIWYEDTVVYHLGDLIDAENLYGESVPVYRGRRPTHRMVPREIDPHWADRLRSALDSRRKTVGAKYSVWIVRHGWGADPPEPGTVGGVVAQQHRLIDSYMDPRITWPTISRYVPVGKPAGTLPGQ